MADPVIDPAAKPWFTDKVDSETIGFWQNKGYDVNDAAAVATGLTKSYREAEKLIGAPAAQMIRLPADPAKDPDGMKAVWQRLGAPADAKDYDFASLKDKDGKIVDTRLEGMLRTLAGSAYLTKDAAAKVADAIVKHQADVKTAESADYEATLIKEKETLAKNWGPNEATNRETAARAATALGLTREMLSALEKVAGYAAVMEGLRTAGQKMGEDKFIRQPGGEGNKIASVDQAKARVAELKADKAWTDRYLNGDSAAKREMGDLMTIIAAATPDEPR